MSGYCARLPREVQKGLEDRLRLWQETHMIEILVADDHPIVREGLKTVISMAPDIAVTGEAANGGEVLALIRRKKFDVLLLDMSMPGHDGVDLIKRVRAEQPLLPILVLTMHGEAQLAASALKLGVAGYLTKGKDVESLTNAIRKVAAGQPCIDPDLAEKIIFNARFFAGPQEPLSEREIQVLRMLQLGKTVTEISVELSLSPKTVSTHKVHLMRKLGIANNADLIRYRPEEGL